ncbi:MAG: hypothetical protein M3O46_11990 [Myxococcota bacterium]|nr:hypothetical protein [Myxococcota bacterium]
MREVSPQSATVWEFKQTDLPAGVLQGNTQSAERLANGNTVIFSSTGGAIPANYPTLVQAVEVGLDRTVRWILRDWVDLGPATTAQFLDQPGIPENPGDLQR